MLNYKEINDIARLKRISLINAEKDYLQDLILFSLYSIVGKELVFKGGTALYKIYKLNRFSEDLDFTINGKLDIRKISKRIISDLELLNIKGKIKEIKEFRNEINVRFLFNGPLYKGSKETQCFIPLNISMKEQILLEPKRERIISLYKEIPGFELFVMQEKEILAEKARAIFTRMKPRDIYDLHFLLRNSEFDILLVNKKLALYGLKFSIKEFKERIEKMKGLWEVDLRNLLANEADFMQIKKDIFDSIKVGEMDKKEKVNKL